MKKAFVVLLALCGFAAAQDANTAYVPFLVNVDATVTAQQGSVAVSMEVTANVERTLNVPLGGGSSVLYPMGTRGPLTAPTVTGSRGNITLRLPPQSYNKVEIALFSVNGKRILRGKAAASEAASTITRRNVAAGVYMLSVKEANGGAFTTRLTHSGGNMNINVAFGYENASAARRLAKSAAAGDWDITVSAAGYKNYTATVNLVKGPNARQEITLAPIYTVTFNINGGSGTTPGALTTENTDSYVTLPYASGLTKNGYYFSGWNTNADGSGSNYTVGNVYTPETNVTLYAKWNPVSSTTYAVMFSSNGGTGSVAGLNVQIGLYITLPSGNGLYRNGASFGGWNTTIDGTGDNYDAGETYTPTDNVTLYAKWILHICTITFNLNGGSGDVPNATTVYAGTGITLPDGNGLTKYGYTFGGWSTDSYGYGDNYRAGAIYTPMSSGTLYAKWDLVYIITFDPNGGNGTPPNEITVNPGSAITLPDGSGLTKRDYVTGSSNHYIFGGWSNNSSGTGTTYAVGSSYTPAGTSPYVYLYVKWTPVYQVSFSVRGGKVSPGYSITDVNGKLDSLPTPTRFGHDFNGWYDWYDCCPVVVGNAITTSTVYGANTTIYAGWTLPQFTDSRDNKTYNKVLMAKQTWMAENLNYAGEGSKCYGEGGLIYDVGMGGFITISSEEIQANCARYGRLYDWATAMTACPTGWHLPSNEEWTTLEYAYASAPGYYLKSASGWEQNSGTDEYGFSALPGGNGDSDGSFSNAGYYGYWWSATENNADNAWYRSMGYNRDSVGRGYGDKTGLFAVRCVQD